MGTRFGTRTRTPEDSGLTAAMRWSIIGVTAVVLAGLTAAAWLLLAPPGVPGASVSATPETPPVDGAHDEGSPSENTPSSSPDPGPSPGAAPVEGSEVLAPTDSTPPLHRLPALPQPTPMVHAPLPVNASARGEVVTGFPTAVAGPRAGDDVLDSSLTSDGDTMQAALTARTDATPEDVAAHFRSAWGALGLTPTGGDQIAASDPFTSVTLAVHESGTGTVYTVFATLRTE